MTSDLYSEWAASHGLTALAPALAASGDAGGGGVATPPFAASAAAPTEGEDMQAALDRIHEALRPATKQTVPDMPHESFLDAAAPFLAAALSRTRPAVQPGLGHELGNIGAIGLIGYLGSRAGANERRFRDYELRRAEAVKGNELADTQHIAELNAARENVSKAASTMRGYDRDFPKVTDPGLLKYLGTNVKLNDRVAKDRLSAAQDAYNREVNAPKKDSNDSMFGDISAPDKAAYDKLIEEITVGNQPPDIIKSMNFRGNGRNYVITGLARNGVDITSLQRDINAQRQFSNTINGRQFTLLRGSEATIELALKRAEVANERVAKFAKYGKNEDWNKFMDEFTKRGFRGTDAYKAVNDREQIAQGARDQIAQVLQAGGTPSEMALSIADDILPSDRTAAPSRFRQGIANARAGFGERKETFQGLKPQKTTRGESTVPAPAPADTTDWFDANAPKKGN